MTQTWMQKSGSNNILDKQRAMGSAISKLLVLLWENKKHKHLFHCFLKKTLHMRISNPTNSSFQNGWSICDFLERHSETKIALTRSSSWEITLNTVRNVCYQLRPCSSGRKIQWENLSYWQLQLHKMSNTSRLFNSLLPKSLLLHHNSTPWFWEVTFFFCFPSLFPHLSLCKKCETFYLLHLCVRFELVPIYSQWLFRHNQVERSSRSQRREDKELREKLSNILFSKILSKEWGWVLLSFCLIRQPLVCFW